MTPLPTLRSLVENVQIDADSEEPLEQLAQAARSVVALESLGDALLSHFVEGCRISGCSWSEISTALGVTKQAAHKRFSSGLPISDRLTPRAVKAVETAIATARSRGDAVAGTEHLLLALFAQPESLATQVLAGAGLSADAVEAQLLPSAADRPEGDEQEPAPGGEVGFSARAVRALRRSVEESLRLGHNYIGTEHILLGLFADTDSTAWRILTTLGLTYDDIRQRVGDKLTEIKQSLA